MDRAIAQLEKWGYEVSMANEYAMAVNGFGMSITVAKDDEAAWEALANEEAHRERVQQQDETVEETLDRLGS